MPMDRVRLGNDLVQPLTPRERVDRQAPATGAVFRDSLAKARVGAFNERIEKMLAEIDTVGQRLGQNLSMADLKKYKQAVAYLFRDLTNHMVQVRADMEWDAQNWEHRTTVTIQRVNEELEKLSEAVVNQEQDRLGILAKIGEIKGMLLDVRM